MADVFTKSKRSQVMAAIRSTGNRDTELKLAAFFRKYRITNWRRNQPVFGKPDFVFRRKKLAVFVDGCFWHGCRWHYRPPKTKTAFWESKISRNKKRALQVNRLLRINGWQVVRIWEHDFRNETKLAARFLRLLFGEVQNDTCRLRAQKVISPKKA